jgi:hypothetical protein
MVGNQSTFFSVKHVHAEHKQKILCLPSSCLYFKKRRRNGNDVNKKNKLIEGKTYQCNLDYQYNEFFLNQDLLFHIIIVLL